MSTPEGPVVDEQRIAQTYEELGQMHMKLDSNPIEFGPKRFNNKIAKVRAMLTRVEQIFLQVSEDLQWLKRTLLRKRSIYELDKRDLLVNEVRVRAGRSQTEREALADVELRDQIESMQELEVRIQDLEMIMVVIKAKRSDLKDMQGRMRDQMKLIEHDLTMGARWGRTIPSDPLSESAGSIDELLTDVDKEGGWKADDDEDLPLVPPSDDPEEEDPAPTADEEPVLEFAPLEDSEEKDPEPQETADDEDEDDSIFGAIEAAIPQEGEHNAPSEDSEESPFEDSVPSESDAEDFLDTVGEEEGDEEDDDSSPFDDGPGIDDLIATLADDA